MIDKINQVALEALKKPFKEAKQTINSLKPLKHLFANNQYFKTEPLGVDTIFPVEKVEKIEENIQKCFDGLVDIDKYDVFTADYLLCKYLSFVAYKDVPLYELCKQEAVFASVKYILENGSEIANNENPLLMINGDFFGIQRFIFESTPSKKAAKTLRAKSTRVQLLTRVIAFHIVEQLGLSYLNIISTSAGKFEIIGVNTTEAIAEIKKIQNELNDYFITNYFGETGIGISVTPCSFADFDRENYRNNLRKSIDENVEKTKFSKFNLLETNPILDYDDDIDNKMLCPYCGKRKRKNQAKACNVCDQHIELGKKLVTEDFLAITKGSGHIKIFGNYYISFVQSTDKLENPIVVYDTKSSDFRGYAKWEIASYVKGGNGHAMDFDELAKLGLIFDGDKKYGIEALIALKGDVDGMGDFIKNSTVVVDFMSFNFFSRMVDYFFSVYTPYLMREKYQNLYTVFAGGDDLFVFGVWSQVIDFAKELREKFMIFVTGSELSFSVGMVLSKPNKPVNSIAHIAEEQLEHSKSLDGKDAIALFGECVKWGEYIKIRDEFIPFLEKFEAKTDLINSAFLYRVLELLEMRQKLKNKDNCEDKDYSELKEICRSNALWKSKLNYTFKRNIYSNFSDKEKSSADELLNKLYKVIENNPKETRMVLSEYIYQRRKNQ
jgi:CRISPR-associated protein Csm1